MAKKRLRLVSREFEGFENTFRHQIEAFKKANPEIDIEPEFVEIHQLYDRMVAAGGSKTDAYDLFLCVTDWLPELMASGGLTPLDEYVKKNPPPDWPDGWARSMRELEVGPDGKLYGLPYHDGPEVFMYRTDLFEDPKEQAAFKARYGYDLGVPETWSQFLDIAKFFTRPEQDLWGTVAASYPDGHNNVYDFLIHLWSRGGALVDRDWKPAFHGPIGREALQYYVDLLHKHKVMSPKSLELDSVKCGFYYASGKAAMMWNWCGFAAVADTPQFSRIVGKNKCSLVPRGDGPGGDHVSLNLYWVLTIPAGSKQKDDAYRFIRHCCTPEMDKITSMKGGNGTRLSTWRDPEVQATFGYYKIIEKVHENVKSPLPVPEYPAMNEALSRMVDDAINLRKSVPQALADAAAETEEIFRKAGYYDGKKPNIRPY